MMKKLIKNIYKRREEFSGNPNPHIHIRENSNSRPASCFQLEILEPRLLLSVAPEEVLGAYLWDCEYCDSPIDDSDVDISIGQTDSVQFSQVDLDRFPANASLPKVYITATDDEAAEENLDTAEFTVSRNGDDSADLLINFTITGTAIMETDYHNLPDSVTIAAGESSAALTVTPMDDDEIEGIEEIILTLVEDSNYQIIKSPRATVEIIDDEGTIVQFGNGSATTIRYTEPIAGPGAVESVITVKLTAAQGTAIFAGAGLDTVQKNDSITVSAPEGAILNSITIENSNAATTLTLKSSDKNGIIHLADITVNGSAKMIQGRQVLLSGDLNVTGGLKKLDWGDCAGQNTIHIGGPDTPDSLLSVKLRNVNDLNFTSDTPIKSMRIENWQNTGEDPDTLNGPWVKKITASQNFAPDVILSDNSVALTLGKVKVGEAITGGSWNIAGNGGKIIANSIQDTWSAVFNGNLAGLTVNQDAGGDLTANSIKKITVKRDYRDASLTLNQEPDAAVPALGSLKISRSMENVEVRANGNIAKVSVGVMKDSNLFAGVNDLVTNLPTDAGEFDTAAKISSFKIKGNQEEPFWFINSNIAAFEVGKISIAYAQTNNDSPFGATFTQFDLCSYQDAQQNIKIKPLPETQLFNIDNFLMQELA